MMLLDTHVLLWFREGGNELGRRTRRLLDQAAARDELAVSAVSFYEIGVHIAKGKVKLSGPLERWRRNGFDLGIGEIIVDSAIAMRASELSGLSGDPFDRIIAATADCRAIGLMTADAKILEWRGSLRRIDARE